MKLSLYLVTCRENLELETFFSIVEAAAAAGVGIVQLREKHTDAREVVAIAKRLQSFLKPMKIPLIINDRVDIAYAVKADGVHLGQDDLSVAEARAILGREAIIGLSVSTIAEAMEGQKQQVDYLAASPLFATPTKSDCNAPWGLEKLQNLVAISRHPIVAIGGINEANIQQVMACGVAGVAVVSAIFNAPCPQIATHTLLQKIQAYASYN